MSATPAPSLRKSTFSIPKMDCPSEENLIRMALGSRNDIESLSFDLGKRELQAVHRGDPDEVLKRLESLNLGAALCESSEVAAPASGTLRESIFAIPKMDCPSEENMIRMALEGLPDLRSLSFDLSKREVAAVHGGSAVALLERLVALNLGATLRETIPASFQQVSAGTNDAENAAEAKTLRTLLAINGVMFVFEMALGLFAQSTGLIADSLDMFADAAVYGLALYAVGRAASMKARAAHLAGWLQMLLALGALFEVGRRFIYGSEPASTLMMGVGLIALIANVTCLVLISKKRDRGAHMTASYIFSANDVIANLGVIAAGVLVAWTDSPYPDLVIGTTIGIIVLNGARRILQLR